MQSFARRGEGDLPSTIDPCGLASYLMAVLQGLAVQAGLGLPRAQLERLVETALLIWSAP